ncbi:MAG: hypothetical protein KatS3mg088_660 [Patescibacteria group bacterium]|nr:MAG: hypothetical protein KatS3mg088_660 [Patescibacteria group bacterium]
MVNPAQNLANQLKKAPSSVAKKVVDETSEVFDDVLDQLLGRTENPQVDSGISSAVGLTNTPTFTEEDRQKQRSLDMSRLRELEAEIAKIRIEKQVRELQERIMRGEPVYLENYSLPIEQKQVLKAQMEAVKQRQIAQVQQQAPKAEPTTRPSRRLLGFGGSKKHAEDLQKSTETRMPPSG